MFVLAHLSDPHLAPLPRPRWRELMGKRATGYLNWQRRRRLLHRSDLLARVVADLKANKPDHIVVTGDLINISLAAEYAPARAWLAALGSSENVTLVPGNHDAYVRSAQPHLHWGDYMRGDDMSEVEFPFLRRRDSMVLIGLSSAVPSLPFTATGMVGDEQIERLAGLLDRSGKEQLFRVVAVHHPPSSRSGRHFKRLVDAAKLRNVLARHGAEMVIHGHDHVPLLVFLKGPHRPIPAIGVASASEAASVHSRPGYNLYRIEAEAGAYRCEMVTRALSTDEETMTEVQRLQLA
jgi:3',5'-cyclic AMP phosphodiesterase CpdA